MAAGNYYSKDKVRRSLKHFVVGKAGGALVGLLTLLLTVRVLSVSDYGLYVALVGYLEIFNVISSFGLNVLSERLVPELRASGHEAKLRSLIAQLVRIRALLLTLSSSLVVLVIWLMGDQLDIGNVLPAVLVYQLVVSFETLARFCESIFDSLLQQGNAQASLLSRTALRLLFLAGVWVTTGHIDLVQWLWLEVLAYGCGLLITLFLTHRTLRRLPRPEEGVAGLRPALRSSIQIYLSQVLGVLVGIDAVKILVLRTSSAEVAAVFGFCASLAWMVQRYLPSYLLVGMVRPLVVAAVAAGKEGSDRLRAIVSIMLKINLLLVGCLVVLMAGAGDVAVNLLSGGKFNSAGALVLLLLIYVWSNSVRALVGYLAMAHGHGASMLWGQVAGALALLIVAVAALGAAGVYAYGAALIAMNATWIALVATRLNLGGQWPALRLQGFVRSVAALTFFSLVASIGGHWVSPLGTYWVIASASVFLLAYLTGSAVFRAFDPDERRMINNMLPKRIFVF